MRCKHIKKDGFQCASYAFNLYMDEIDQGELCDVHYWQEKAQPEQEPVAKYSDIVSDGGLDPRNKFTIPPQRTEQEPVAIRHSFDGYGYKYTDMGFGGNWIGWTKRQYKDSEPLYTHSQRTWVGLTGEEAMDVTRKEGHELLDFIYEYGTGSEGVEERIVAICKAIEAKLKEKNT